jgi:hypothetical protein
MGIHAALWILVPLALVHVAVWRRREILIFQLLVDVGLLLLPGRLLIAGAHLGPGVVGGAPWGTPTTVIGSPEQSDLPLQFEVWWEEVRRLAAAGQPPWVSDRLGGGVPLYGNGQSELPFPLQLPVWVLGAERGTDVMAVWKLELAALGVFFMLRRLRARPAAAALAGVTFAFGLYPLSWLVVPLAWVVAAAPWALWALLGTVRGRRSSAAVLAVLLGMLAGWSVHAETAAFLWLAVALFGLVVAWGRWRRARRLVAPFVLALAVAGIGALPTLATVADSAKLRAAQTGTYPSAGVSWALRAKAAALVLVPWREGHPADGSWTWPFPAAVLSVGVGSLALVLLVAARPRRRLRRHALALAALGFLGAGMLWQVPGIAHVLARLPVFGLLTWPRAGFLVGLALAPLAGLGLDAWLRRGRTLRLVLSAAVVQAAIFALLATGADRRIKHNWPGAGMPIVAALTAPLAAVSGGWTLPALALAEQFALARNLVPGSLVLGEPAPILAALQARVGAEGGRVVALGAALPANLGARIGVADLRDHDPVRALALARLHRALGAAGMDLPGQVTSPWAGLAGAWGVRWLVTPAEGIAGPAAAGWAEAFREINGVIYRNPRCLPILRVATRAVVMDSTGAGGAWESVDFASEALVDQPLELHGGASLAVLEAQPARTVAVVRTGGRVLTLLHRPYAPGWSTRLDGQPAPIVSANFGAMGVVVPAGTHEVRWEYRPPLLWPGAALTMVGLAGCAWLGLGARRRRA